MTDNPAPNQVELLRQVRLALKDDDVTSAIVALEQLTQIAFDAGNIGAAGRHLGNLALMHYRLGDTQKALEYFNEAVECAREDNDRITEGGLLGNMGNILREAGYLDEAVDHLNQALIISNEMGDMRGRGIWVSNLGLLYDDLKRYDRAVEMHRQAVDAARRLHDQRGLAARLGNLGNSYVNLGNYESALKHFTEAVDIIRQIGEPAELAIRLAVMGNLYGELGREATGREAATQHFAQALRLYAEGLEIAQNLEDRRQEAALLRSVGNVLASAYRFDDAIQYFRAAEKVFSLLGLDDERERIRQSIELCMHYRDQMVN